MAGITRHYLVLNMSNKKFSLYNRYNNITLLFKFVLTTLLTNRFSQIAAIWVLKTSLRLRVSSIARLLNGIYFGGETLSQAEKIVEDLAKNKIFSVLDYAVEGQENEIFFEEATASALSLVKLAVTNENIPYVVVKPSSLGGNQVYEHISKELTASPVYEEQWQAILLRYDRIFRFAEQNNVHIMIDAEQSWVNAAVMLIAKKGMQLYNKNKAIVTITVQCYKRDSLNILESIKRDAAANDYVAGVKIVRGAYLEEEKNAGERSLDAFFTRKEETDRNYNLAIDYILNNIDYFLPFFATHNSYSLEKIMDATRSYSENFWVGQLYGIADSLSLHAVNNGIKVCKYLPYGPFDKSLPYLIRRIEENAVAIETFRKENLSIKKELVKRIKGF